MNIEKYKKAIVQIATPWSTGTGFYLKTENLIVTNNHVVDGAREVVISTISAKKELVEVLYSDAVFDLAFLKAPKNTEFSEIKMNETEKLIEGQKIMAIGHPFGLKFSATQGIISKASRNWNGINYIQIDAAINPGNSGGPLINEKNEIVGVNTFILSNGQNLGFALPISYLQQTIKEFKKFAGEYVIRCSSCSNLLTKKLIDDGYCSHCGAKFENEQFDGKKYTPSYAGGKIEEIIKNLNYDVKLSRIGRNFWEIEEGSAKISINYNPNTKYVVSYSTLCRLPKENIGTVYEYLLDENSKMKSLSFSVRNQDIILSSMYVYDEDMHIDTGIKLFKNLFLKSDYYDDILIDMGSRPIER